MTADADVGPLLEAQEEEPQRQPAARLQGLLARGLLAGALAAVLLVLLRYATSWGQPGGGHKVTDTATELSDLSGLWQGAQCGWLAGDNCVNADAVACECRRMNPDGPCTPCPNSRKREPGQEQAPQAPQAPAPPPPPAGAALPRKGSFLIIGDWGYDYSCHGNVPDVTCQQAIADKMLAKMNELGDVKFVINVGDSFYPHGLVSKGDSQWESKWRKIFPKPLRDVPWYSVYGNHDLQHDPCACSDNIADCAQVNGDVNNLDYFYMPGPSWFREHPELGLEVIGLELNHFMQGWDKSKGIWQQGFEDCQYTPCQAKCEQLMKSRAEAAFELFERRRAQSTAQNLVVFSHYPTDYFTSKPEFLEQLSDDSRHKILYLGGHRHNVDQTTTKSIAPNVNWLVGGGGGWSCDGPDQGFVVGEIGADSQITTYAVTVDESLCCHQGALPSMWKGQGCEWLGCDNCIDMSAQMCSCREQNPNGPCTPCRNGHTTSIGRNCSGSACTPPI